MTSCCCPVLHQSGACSEGGGNCLFFNLPARKLEEMMCLWDSDTYLNHPKSSRHPHSPQLREWHELLLTELFELTSICYLTPVCSSQWQVVHTFLLLQPMFFFPRVCTLLHNCWYLEFTGLLAEFRRTAIPNFQLKILFPLCSIDTFVFLATEEHLEQGLDLSQLSLGLP